MTTMMTKARGVAACGALAVLAACGGGGGSDEAPPPVQPSAPPPTAAVPASASASVSGFVTYLMQLVAAPADTLQPVDVNQVTPPTSETASPMPTN
jgi:ABC-type phosphate transport system substrate-binding protein